MFFLERCPSGLWSRSRKPVFRFFRDRGFESRPLRSSLRYERLAVLGGIIWYVYILKMSDGEYYVGSTNNLKRRIDEYTKGRAIPTKWRLPLILEAYVAVKSETTARSLEKYLKTSSGKSTLRKRILPDEALA